LLAGLDPEKAKQIYRYHDYRLVKAMRNTWQQLEMQKAQVQLEAAVYGMGGSFEDEDCEVYDLTTGDYSAEELNRLINTNLH
jgi:RecA/RadA recombinase